MTNNIFVTLPENFIACPKHPGYFYNIQDRKLYSIKSGLLTPMKHYQGNQWNKFHPGYRVSIGGVRKSIRDEYLINLEKKQSIIPIRG